MKDRSVEFPNRYRLTKVAGTNDIYDLIPAPGDVTDEGTYINKATLLKDSTAALYGLGEDAVPDDVMAMLKSLVDDAQTTADDAKASADIRARIATGSYTGTGAYGESNPNSLTFDFEPKFLIVYISKSTQTTGGSTSLTWVGQGGQAYSGNNAVSVSGNKISWYGISESTQLNSSGTIYHYIAIG